MRKIVLILFAAVALVLLAGGCVVERGRNPESTLPANEPAKWEGTTLGVPI